MAEVRRFEVAGREHIALTSDQVYVECVPALGGTVVAMHRVDEGTELLWRPPWGLRSALAAPLPGSPENTAVDQLVGGWSTIFPNGSEAAVVDGADWPAAGEARLAWCDWQQTPSSLILTSRLVRSPFLVTRVISLQGDEVTIGETVRNVGQQHLDVIWGSQVVFDGALLGPRARFDAQAALVRPDARQTPTAGYDDILPWPRSYAADGLVNLRTLPDADARVSRTAYLSDFGAHQARLSNPDLGLQVEIGWDGDVWPYAWYQLETGGRSGYPWWGSARFLALTPCSSWPATGIGEVRRISATSLRIHPDTARTAQMTVRIRAR